MKFTAIAAGAVFAASVVVAAPNTAARWAKHEARRAGRSGGFRQPAEDDGVYAVNGTDKNVDYSTNWAGAVLSSSGYTKVVGTFTVPTPKAVNGKAGSASAWVGIDGDTCGTAILQTGMDFNVAANGKVSYDGWYEWYPDCPGSRRGQSRKITNIAPLRPPDAYDFTGITFSAGDQVTVTVVASSKSAGTATIQNLSTGKSVSHSFSSEKNQLCEYDAEWIVEDYESGGSLVSLANFGTVTFTGASAVKSGTTVGVTGADILDIKQSNTIYTDCSTSGSSTVTCKYV
ncbi:peptidase A4 family-domain-containing protein [Xylariaceae sp. FL1272]|nr:peptidase A4 family-domain-containing protein [Xylariaceae sp. FL1272]